MAGDGRKVRRKGIVAAGGGIAVLLMGILLAVGLIGRGGGGGTAQASGEIYLTPAGSTGPNPFTASLMTKAGLAEPTTAPVAALGAPPVVVPAPQGGAAVTSTSAPVAPAAAGAPATALTSVDASVPQLYGGQMGVSPCDSGLLVHQLDGDTDVATSWAQAEGVDRDGVDGFVTALVPVDLLDDVRVTDFRRVDGRGVPVQVVLERGTTVLVDRYGLPRVRCQSGDPLALPDRVLRSARFVGTRWARFEPATVIAIVPAATAVPTLVLLDVASGRPFGRTVDGARADIDPDTLVADQARLGVTVNAPPDPSPDAAQDVQLSPWGGPPGSTVLAFGTGWPAGDRVRIEPCVGGRPETCALRTDAAVFTVVGPDGSFRAVELRVPGDVSGSDYVEFYVQDLRDDHRARTFDSPWTVASAECRDDCAAVAGCHPPFCGGGGDQHQHGCRCMVRSDPVCQFDSCDSCPKDRCIQALREEPTPSPRPRPSGSGGQSQGTQSQHGSTAQQFAGPGSSTRTTSMTTAESSTAASSTTRSETTQSSRSTRTDTQTGPPTHTQTTQTTQGGRTTQTTTHTQTAQTTTAPAHATQAPSPSPRPTPRPTPPPPTQAPSPSPSPRPTPHPTPPPSTSGGHSPGASPQPQPSQHPGPPYH